MSEPKTVTMEAITDGTYGGERFQTGDLIEVEEQYVETMTLARLAVPANRVEAAAEQREETAAAKVAAEKPPAVKPRTPPRR